MTTDGLPYPAGAVDGTVNAARVAPPFYDEPGRPGSSNTTASGTITAANTNISTNTNDGLGYCSSAGSVDARFTQPLSPHAQPHLGRFGAPRGVFKREWSSMCALCQVLQIRYAKASLNTLPLPLAHTHIFRQPHSYPLTSLNLKILP